MKPFTIFLASLLLPPFAWPGEVDFESKLIGRSLPYSVIVPDGYNDAEHKERRWPVVILLHGWDGNHHSLIAGDASEREAARLGWIIAIPEGEARRFWSDSTSEPREMFERYLIEEWLPHLKARFRCSDYRVVAGYSAGGYGALKLAFKHPKLFAAAIGLGAEPRIADFPPDFEKQARTIDPAAIQRMNEVFGTRDSPHRRANQIFRLAAQRTVPGPQFTLICGRAEPPHRMESNRELAKLLSISLQETEAKHSWGDYAADFAKTLKAVAPKSDADRSQHNNAE